MAFLSAGPAARVSLKWGIREEGEKERARFPAPSTSSNFLERYDYGQGSALALVSFTT